MPVDRWPTTSPSSTGLFWPTSLAPRWLSSRFPTNSVQTRGAQGHRPNCDEEAQVAKSCRRATRGCIRFQRACEREGGIEKRHWRAWLQQRTFLFAAVSEVRKRIWMPLFVSVFALPVSPGVSGLHRVVSGRPAWLSDTTCSACCVNLLAIGLGVCA